MARATHYCITCETHIGGPPNDISPEEHIEIAHDGGLAQIEAVSDR